MVLQSSFPLTLKWLNCYMNYVEVYRNKKINNPTNRFQRISSPGNNICCGGKTLACKKLMRHNPVYSRVVCRYQHTSYPADNQVVGELSIFSSCHRFNEYPLSFHSQINSIPRDSTRKNYSSLFQDFTQFLLGTLTQASSSPAVLPVFILSFEAIRKKHLLSMLHSE